jgi:LuxR family maltose regulon positive regulatory protein
VRVFVDEGPQMTELLHTTSLDGAARDHAQRVLAASFSQPVTPSRSGPVGELSSRELDVLRLLRSDLTGPDIARELLVSLNTLRTHTKNIYAKLGVNNRREAIRRATELGL